MIREYKKDGRRGQKRKVDSDKKKQWKSYRCNRTEEKEVME